MDRRLALAAALALLPALNAGAARASASETKKGGGVSYTVIKSISATIMRRDGSRGVISIECGVDIADDALRAVAQVSVPRLRAAYAEFIQTYVGGLPRAAVPDADYIAAEMQRRTDQVLGKKGAKFLIGTVLIN